MVPHTDDGRVLFAIPWHDRVVVGTTDTPVDDISLEPLALKAEIDFLLNHAARLEKTLPGGFVHGAEVVWAVRHEMARTVEDFLARRRRSLFLDARVAMAMAPEVASLMAAELKKGRSGKNRKLNRFAKKRKTIW